jgi:microcin C transport system permease protein
MLAYIARRLLLIIPTLFGIMVLNFVIVQFAPGGPVEQTLAELKGTAVSAAAPIVGNQADVRGAPSGETGGSAYVGARGLDPGIIKDIERMYGFDKPAHERFWMMMKDYATFDFGESFFKGRPVLDLVLDKMPVSISLGLWTTLIVYLVCIPLGIAKAVRDGSKFDIWTSIVIIVTSAIPGYLFAVLLIVLFAGGSFLQLFPLQHLTSPNWDVMTWPDKIVDYFWHLALPLTALVIGSFASLTLLTKKRTRSWTRSTSNM